MSQVSIVSLQKIVFVEYPGGNNISEPLFFLWRNKEKDKNSVDDLICKEVVYIYTLHLNTSVSLFHTGIIGHNTTDSRNGIICLHRGDTGSARTCKKTDGNKKATAPA